MRAATPRKFRVIDGGSGKEHVHETTAITPTRAHFEIASRMITDDSVYGHDDPQALAEMVCDLAEALGLEMSDRYGDELDRSLQPLVVEAEE